MRLPAIAATIAAALPCVAAAQDVTPAAELAGVKPFARNWSCDETVRDDAGKDVKVKSEWKLKPVARGFWFAFDYNQKNSKEFPGFQEVGHFGWDATDKKLVMIAFDDGGGRWSYTAAPPEKNVIAWSGEAHLGGGTVPVRYTWTLAGDKAAGFVLELQVNNEWLRFADGSCKAAR
jgi:hypothetical protein